MAPGRGRARIPQHIRPAAPVAPRGPWHATGDRLGGAGRGAVPHACRRGIPTGPWRRHVPGGATIETGPTPPLLLAGTAEEAVRDVAFAAGHALVVTRPKPERDGPNQDAVAVVDLGRGRGVLALADGAGGHAQGAAAAGTTLRILLEVLATVPADAPSLRPFVLDGIERANERVIALGVGAATTLAVVEVEDGVARSYHAGDSEILVVGQRGRIRHQVVPHSPTGYAIESGLLDADAAMVHEDRHLVSNVVGDASMRIEVGPPIRLHPRDTVLVASDGLFDNLRGEEVVEVVRKGPLEAAARTLTDRAAERMRGENPELPGKPDDLSFLLYRQDRPRVRRQTAETT